MDTVKPPAQPQAHEPSVSSFPSRVNSAAIQVEVVASFTDRFDEGAESEDLVEERQPKPWRLRDLVGSADSGEPIKEVFDPTASKIRYKSLHPAIYRYMVPVSDLDRVAQDLGVVEDWRAEAARIWRLPYVREDFRTFVGLANTATETTVQGALWDLITTMAFALRRRCNRIAGKCALVRGTLALDHLTVRGVAGLVFRSGNKPILAAEVKTAESWPQQPQPRPCWFAKSRGVQLYQTLYAYRCPTLLVTQEQFKLFWENDSRTCVSTFPSAETADDARDDVKFRAALNCQPTFNRLFHALVVCLLRAEPYADDVASDTELTEVGESMRPGHVTNTTNSTPGRSAAANRASATDSDTPTANRVHGVAVPLPQFFTGMYDASGEPIFQTVHVELVDQVASDTESEEPLCSAEAREVFGRVDGGLAL